MKTLKCIIMAGVIGTSLLFGANELKAQEKIGCECHKEINGDQYVYILQSQSSSNCEEIVGFKEDLNKKGFTKGTTIIYYVDKNNDGFHESIKVFNKNKPNYIVVENFHIDKLTGFLDYGIQIYHPTPAKLRKYYGGKTYLSVMKEESYDNFNRTASKYCPNLKIQKIHNLYDGFKERAANLINASENESALKDMLRQDRLLWENRFANPSEKEKFYYFLNQSCPK